MMDDLETYDMDGPPCSNYHKYIQQDPLKCFLAVCFYLPRSGAFAHALEQLKSGFYSRF